MPAALERACRNCGRPHVERALVCDLCGHLLRREPRSAAPARVDPGTRPRPTPGLEPPEADSSTADSSAARTEPWAYLALGLVTAPLLFWTPLLRYMGWFLAALVHEMGHAALAWLCGMPAVPAISLAGHAVAVHGEPSLLVALTAVTVLGSLLWRGLEGRARALALAILVLVYPAVAFTDARDVLHLLAGHGAELLFATLCLWKTLDGGFTDSRLERALHGTLGWSLLGRNVGLCFGLLTSPAARAEYRTNGSFGLVNDYLRVAEQLGVGLPAVALAMLAAGLCVLPASASLWRLSVRSRHRIPGR